MMPDIRPLILSMLDDDHGVSARTWEMLIPFLGDLEEYELLGELADIVKATDGRFYIPSA